MIEEIDEFELNSCHAKALCHLAKIKRKDVFYDLGSGTGKVIVEIAKNTSCEKIIGIEIDGDRHCLARKEAIRRLSKAQLLRTDLWFGDVNDFDISDATIVYNSLNEEEDEIELYKEQFGNKRVKILKKDIPLVGYQFITDRSNSDCWLFLTSYPLKRVKSKKLWAQMVLGKADATVEDVFSYYDGLLRERELRRKDRIDSVLGVKKLVNMRF